MKTMMFTFSEDNRFEKGMIVSRIGIKSNAHPFNNSTDIHTEVSNQLKEEKVDCLLVDEAQFLTKKQVHDLGRVVDELNIPVLTFGIRTDFQGELFEGSKYLLAWADNLKEIKTVCWCGRKATMVVRINDKNEIISEGEQIEIGGNERYVPLCRSHFVSKNLGN